MFKLTVRAIPVFLFVILLACARPASAQGVSMYFGVGSAFDGAATGLTPGGASCPSKQIYDDFTGDCENSPTMGGAFGVFGGDFMITPHLGVNGEYSFRFAQANYLPDAYLKYRPGFYDFNAIYEPGATGKRVVPVIEGGVGGAKVSLYFNQTECVTSVCANENQYFTTANHFQVHGAVGVKLYVKPSIFIKPQFDIHYVDNLNQQFSSDVVPEFTVSIGFTFGEH